VRCETVPEIAPNRFQVPRSLGYWFAQTDIAEFGAGASSFFQGFQIILFCESVRQIDFSDLSSILPFDVILVRRSEKGWRPQELERLVDYIREDLTDGGDETEIDATSDGNLADLRLLYPNYGLM
jgi:hypothetical protein